MAYWPWALAKLRRPFVDTRSLVVIRRKLPSDRVTVDFTQSARRTRNAKKNSRWLSRVPWECPQWEPTSHVYIDISHHCKALGEGAPMASLYHRHIGVGFIFTSSHGCRIKSLCWVFLILIFWFLIFSSLSDTDHPSAFARLNREPQPLREKKNVKIWSFALLSPAKMFVPHLTMDQPQSF